MNTSATTLARLCVFGAWLTGGVSLAFLVAPTTAHAQPVANRVLQLDGTNSYVELPDNLLANLDAVTVEMWVRAEDLSQAHFIQLGQVGHEFYLGLPDQVGTLKLLYTDAADNRTRIEKDGVVASNRWFHVAAVLTGTGARLYYNGALVGTNPTPVPLKAIEPTDNVLGRADISPYDRAKPIRL